MIRMKNSARRDVLEATELELDELPEGAERSDFFHDMASLVRVGCLGGEGDDLIVAHGLQQAPAGDEGGGGLRQADRDGLGAEWFHDTGTVAAQAQADQRWRRIRSSP